MRVTVIVATVVLTVWFARPGAAEPQDARPLHWQHATLSGLVLVDVERNSLGNFAVTVPDAHVYQEFEYSAPRYGDGRLYVHHTWEIWRRPPLAPRTHLGIRDFDAPKKYHRIIFFASTKRGDVPQWLEVREGTEGVIVEVTKVLP